MSHRSSFPPVYPNLGKDPTKVHQGCPRFPVADVKTIVSVVGNSSIITHICQHAIRHATATILRNNWSLVDYERFEHYLRERSLVTIANPQTSPSDVSRRDKGHGESTAHRADERPGVRKVVKR